jgi:RimJ/RimL family protein N-acetyltransferase
MTTSSMRAREMQPAEVDIVIDYFHDASDEHLDRLGVDRALLPARTAWREFYAHDCARPLPERSIFWLAWESDDEIIGFSSADQISFGEQAFMHLHILRPDRRRCGLGVQFVRQSATIYFRVLELQRLFSQPNALNVAPNRTLQRAGFQYVLSEHTIPGPINCPQVVTRWVLKRPA